MGFFQKLFINIVFFCLIPIVLTGLLGMITYDWILGVFDKPVVNK